MDQTGNVTEITTALDHYPHTTTGGGVNFNATINASLEASTTADYGVNVTSSSTALYTHLSASAVTLDYETKHYLFTGTQNASNDALYTVLSPTVGEPDYEAGIPEGLVVAIRVYLGCVAVFGSFGNMLTIVAVAVHKKLQNAMMAYVLNLAVTDWLVCSVLIPVALYTYKHPLPDDICQAVGFFNLLFLMVSVFSLALISINRYVLVCKSRSLYTRLYSRSRVCGSIILTWVIAVTIFMPPFLGFGQFGYNPKFGTCLFKHPDTRTYMFVLLLPDGLLIFPTVNITVYCYIKILMKFRKSRRRMRHEQSRDAVESSSSNDGQAAPTTTMAATTTLGPESVPRIASCASMTSIRPSSTPSGPSRASQASRKKTIAVIRNLLVVWLVFLAAWMPVVLLHKVDYSNFVPPIYFHVLFAIAQSNSAVNFILYAVMNTNFRNAYKNLLCCQNNKI